MKVMNFKEMLETRTRDVYKRQVSGRTEFFGAGNYGIGDKGVGRWREEKYVNGAETVSYTHLDVYKRQPLLCTLPGR